MDFELTAREIESEQKEAEAINKNKIWFMAENDKVIAIASKIQPENSFSGFWMAYAECAEKRGDIVDFEYGLSMAQISDKNCPEMDF
jgi:hypothetical protein